MSHYSDITMIYFRRLSPVFDRVFILLGIGLFLSISSYLARRGCPKKAEDES